jgi:pyocin large subunit-like protein
VPESLTFKFRRLLEKHYDDHGSEVGATDVRDYEKKAVAFMTAQVANPILEKLRRVDGARIRYNYVTQEFGIVSADNYIQTYFKPDPRFHGMSTNRAYFEWECNRR